MTNIWKAMTNILTAKCMTNKWKAITNIQLAMTNILRTSSKKNVYGYDEYINGYAKIFFAAIVPTVSMVSGVN